MFHQILVKFGYTKMEYLHQSRARVREQKEHVKVKNLEITQNKIDLKKLRVDIHKLQEEKSKTNTIKFSKPKLKVWADKVKKSKCCDICDATKVPLSAHHLWAKSKHPTLAYEHANGVALCLTCHDGYHKKYHHIEDCNPFTYQEYKTDEQNKLRLAVVENEVEILKTKTFKGRFKQALSRVMV